MLCTYIFSTIFISFYQIKTLILHQFFMKNLDSNQETRANETFSQGLELK